MQEFTNDPIDIEALPNYEQAPLKTLHPKYWNVVMIHIGIFLFLLATVLRTYAPDFILPSLFDSLVIMAKTGLTVTLFLVGASLSRETLKKVGVRPLAQGILLWIVISIVSLWAILSLL